MTKSLQHKTLTGTLGSLAEKSGFDYFWLRLSFVFLALITQGWAILLYIALFFLIPGPRRTRIRKPLRSRAFILPRFFIDFWQTISHGRYWPLFAFVFLFFCSWSLVNKGLGAFSVIFFALALAVLFSPRPKLTPLTARREQQEDIEPLSVWKEASGRPN